MMDIDSFIEELQEYKKQGYKKIIIVDDAIVNGWHDISTTVPVVRCPSTPDVIYIDARTKKE